MTTVVQPPTGVSGSPDALPVPDSWTELRREEEIQFESVDIPEPEPPEPNWFDKFLEDVSDWFAELFGPMGGFFGSNWGGIKWVLLVIAVLIGLYAIYRMVGPMGLRPKSDQAVKEVEPEWSPDQQESLALLEEADRLAAEGKFDVATHLLLQRSVGQIAAARPDWVEPSSTARELASLPALSDNARSAFAVISERVERSLFALRALDRGDWEVARAAYADFALAEIDDSRALRGSA